MDIYLSSEDKDVTPAMEAAVVGWAELLLSKLGLPEVELSIVLCSDPFIHQLNQSYRGVDAPTDVLSFAMGDGEDADLNPDVLGDVVISLDTADRQAQEHGHPLDTELQVLLVHGLLHLLGFDHEEPEERAEMQGREAELLGWLKAGPVGLIARVS